MGIIRKTASVGTLGLISFRSKKEKLARAERKNRETMSALDAERLARGVAEAGFTKVEHELRRLSDSEAKAARQLARLRKRSRRVRRAERLNGLLNAVQPSATQGVESARHAVSDMAEKSRHHGRRARKAAKKMSHDMRVSAEKAAEKARDTAEKKFDEAKNALSSN